ncbi:MAG TPA: lysophospholipase [Bdellovibrionales bacterium]|jgi:alpha-beta hydrolase superfamily lysophospholipase|nr:lysophospholipase [Bdellovibrionales bacterium]
MATERREGHFKNESEIFYQTWTTPKAFATLVVTHGIGEHSESYAKTAARLSELGWNTIAWDLRGHGRSEGKRGHVDKFSDYADDLSALLKHLGKTGHLAQPFVIVGHSMGGLVVLDQLLRAGADTPKPHAAVLSSPLLGVALKVPPAKDFAARVMQKVWPSITLFNEIKYEDLTRDAEHLSTYAKDALRHEKISPSLYLGMFETMEVVNRSGSRIELPILIQAAGEERIVSLPAIRDFFPTIGSTNKKLLIYNESYHEIFNDLDREKVFADFNDFLLNVPGIRSSK